MIFSELCRSFSRSCRAKNMIINGCYKGRRAGLRDESASLHFYSSLNRSDPKLGFLRSYLASIGAQKKDYFSDTSKYVYANPRFCRFFSGETSENFCSKEKKFSKSDQKESESNESKSNNEDQENFQEAFMKQFQDIFTPLIVFGLFLLALSSYRREAQYPPEGLYPREAQHPCEAQKISFQEFKDKLLEPGQVDHVELVLQSFLPSFAKVYVRSSPRDQTSNDTLQGTPSFALSKYHSGEYKYYIRELNTLSFLKKLSELKEEMGDDLFCRVFCSITTKLNMGWVFIALVSVPLLLYAGMEFRMMPSRLRKAQISKVVKIAKDKLKFPTIRLEFKSNMKQFQEAFMKQFQNILVPLSVIGLVLLPFSFGSREVQQISFQEFRDMFPEAGLVDRVEVFHKIFNPSIAKVYVRNSQQDQTSNDIFQGEYKYYIAIENDAVTFRKKLEEVQMEMKFPLIIEYGPFGRTFIMLKMTVPILVLGSVMYWGRKMQSGPGGKGAREIFNIGKAQSTKVDKNVKIRKGFEEKSD